MPELPDERKVAAQSISHKPHRRCRCASVPPLRQVGLAGPSGSGKTAFSEKIKSFIPGCCLLSMDNYNDGSKVIDGNFDGVRLEAEGMGAMAEGMGVCSCQLMPPGCRCRNQDLTPEGF